MRQEIGFTLEAAKPMKRVATILGGGGGFGL